MSADQMTMDLRAADLGRSAAAAHIGQDACEIITRWTLAIADQAGTDGFTADDVRMTLPFWIARKLEAAPNALGSIFKGLARARSIRPSRTHEPRVARHKGARGRKQQVWIREGLDP